VIRPVSVYRGTIEALEKRGLIKAAKGEAPLTVVWRATKDKQGSIQPPSRNSARSAQVTLPQMKRG
jgi:hypothetical protein